MATDIDGEGVAVFAAARPLTVADLREAVGAEQYSGLTARQRAGLKVPLEIVRGWRAFARAEGVRWRRFGAAKRQFVAWASNRYGRRITVRLLDSWLLRERRGGAGALIDRRGRPRGDAASVDPGLLGEFGRRLAAGESVAQAHRAVRALADRDGCEWPRSIASVRRWFDAGRAVVERQAPEENRGSYLVAGIGLN